MRLPWVRVVPLAGEAVGARTTRAVLTCDVEAVTALVRVLILC